MKDFLVYTLLGALAAAALTVAVFWAPVPARADEVGNPGEIVSPKCLTMELFKNELQVQAAAFGGVTFALHEEQAAKFVYFVNSHSDKKHRGDDIVIGLFPSSTNTNGEEAYALVFFVLDGCVQPNPIKFSLDVMKMALQAAIGKKA